MKSASAIRAIMNVPGYNPDMLYTPIKMTELKEFKAACTTEEWTEFGQQACGLLGQEHEA